jgi:hypothetical protein
MYGIQKLGELPLDGTWTMTLTDRKETRKDIQNRLYWCWIHDIFNSTGNSIPYVETETDLHHLLANKLLAPIYLREPMNPEQERFCDRWNYSMKHLWNFEQEVIEQVIAPPSTTIATVRQFAEYLTAITHFAMDNGAQIMDHRDAEYAMTGRR